MDLKVLYCGFWVGDVVLIGCFVGLDVVIVCVVI